MVKGKKAGKQNSNGKGSQKELSPNATKYSGPIVRPMDKKEMSLTTISLPFDTALTSVAGSIQNVFKFEDPSSATDWSSAAALYDEYRVLGLQIDFVPNMEESQDSTNYAYLHAPVYSVLDRDTNGGLTSYSQATNYESVKTHTLTKKWSVDIKMEGPNVGASSASSAFSETLFVNCQAIPSVTGAIKLYSTGLTTAATYGRIIGHYLVQFRGRAL